MFEMFDMVLNISEEEFVYFFVENLYFLFQFTLSGIFSLFKKSILKGSN